MLMAVFFLGHDKRLCCEKFKTTGFWIVTEEIATVEGPGKLIQRAPCIMVVLKNTEPD